MLQFPEQTSEYGPLRRAIHSWEHRHDAEFFQLVDLVVEKLTMETAENGTASLFHDKKSDELVTVLTYCCFTSPKIPCLEVMLWKETNQPDSRSLEIQLEIFGVTHHRILLDAIESLSGEHGGRGIAVVQRWGSPPNEWDIIYRRNTTDEAGNMPVPRATSEKIAFLKQILETVPDLTVNEMHFGRPYVPGDYYTTTDDLNSKTRHSKHWARDLKKDLLRLHK